ncbi:unnamed protein product [Trichogramma brassicae]|uniref:Reverse transcriptase domain-containing protein n=1 Tax=Trichogramma brassicae TaxID=86971 RepID=A0A6H5ISP5_9HYME|nr:unnamed protein product [Trichogramma brassicae]
MYDRILRLELPRPAKIVGFADDIAITVVAKHLDLVEFYSNETIRLVRAALTELGLQTADQKNEVLLVTSRKVTETITVRAGGHYITSAPCIRYLGVHIDARLRFEEHLRIVSDKANRVAGALLGLMPNIGGPRSSRRRLYANVVDLILLYGALAWSEAAKKQSYTRRAASIHRRACLRVFCGFCSISHEATYVLASIPPLTLLIDERSRLYSRRLESVGSEERAKTIEEWQAQWTRSRKGRWTHRLIPNITPWIERRHGEVDYHLTQLLTGHGCFRSYLCWSNNDTSDLCPVCPAAVEDVEHVAFRCPRFTEEREVLHRLFGGPLEPEMLVGFMLETESNWLAVSTFAHSVMTRLRGAKRGQEEDDRMMRYKVCRRAWVRSPLGEFSRFVFFAWCGRACARGGAGTTQKEDPGYVISLRSGKKKNPITVRAGSDRITISRSPRRGLTKLAIDGAQHSHDEVRSENHTHKRAPDAGAKAQLERMMVPEARTTLTR